MARLSIGQKVERVLRFLMGMRNRRVASALSEYGFSQADLDEGWTLLRSVAGDRLNTGPVPELRPEHIAELDQWENRWFPIAKAVLAHRHPAQGEKLFLNLSQTEGPAVAVSVSTFLDRLAALASGDEEDRAARAVLASRGLSEAEVTRARELLADLGTVEGEPVDLAAERAAIDEAEGRMWAWYLEWSTIARVGIKDGHLLQLLGFRRGKRAAAGAAGEEALDETDEGLDEADEGDPEEDVGGELSAEGDPEAGEADG